MKHKILALGPLPKAQMVLLCGKYDVISLWREDDPETCLQAHKEDIKAIVSTAWNPVSAKLMSALPNLALIANFGVGYDNIDMDMAGQLGIAVTNTPDVLTDDVADFAMGLLLSLYRRMVEGDIYARSGFWQEKGMMPLGSSVRGQKMGIVGMGRIGRAIADRAEVFGIQISYHGPNEKAGLPYTYYKDLSQMAADVDVLMVSCAATTETENLIDAGVIQKLGREGRLINISRGSVIDEEALVTALSQEKLKGAALDVFAHEPQIPKALKMMDNVVLQPHQASATHETRAAMGQLVIDNLAAYFNDGLLLTQVN